MKRPFLAICFLFVSLMQLQAQSGSAGKVENTSSSPKLDTVDSVLPFMCLDSTVVSFRVTIISKGLATETNVTGYCCYLRYSPGSGSRVFLTDIISAPQAGVRVRLPDKNYYVR